MRDIQPAAPGSGATDRDMHECAVFEDEDREIQRPAILFRAAAEVPDGRAVQRPIHGGATVRLNGLRLRPSNIRCAVFELPAWWKCQQ
jgi:hypothetical protein